MSYLYVCDQGSVVGINANRIQVKNNKILLSSVPVEGLEVIEVFGNVQVTTQCLTECLKRGIMLLFYSTYGAYYGRLVSTNHVNVARQRRQAELDSDEQLKIEFSKKIIDAKIRNQIVILRRYARHKSDENMDHIDDMKRILYKLQQADSINKVMGYEGHAAKIYFLLLGKLIDPDFKFTKRSKRPPLDPFNSMISLGYSIILNEIYGKLEAKGLNPYFALMHKDREKHPTLASDLMEEWRVVLVDATVMSMINGHEISKEDFYYDHESPGVYLTQAGFKAFIRKMESKIRTQVRYLSYIDYPVSFRRALDLQINQYTKMLETGDVNQYHPLIIR